MVSPVLKQTWIVVGVLLNMLGQGMLLGYTSILLPSLKSPDSDIKVDIHTASIIVSIIAIAAMPGLLVTSLLMELYGRRFAYGFIVVPGVVGWLFIYYAKSVLILVIGRGLGGFSAGALVSLGAVVIGEYTSPKNRGMFLNLKTAAICLGNLIVHVLGQIYHWRTVALISLTPITMSLLFIFTWPESPAWLASKYKYKECEKSFFWLRGNNLESTNEMEKLLRAQKVKKSEATDANITCKLVEIIKKFKRRDFAKPIVIVLFGFLLLESCGRHIFPAFSLQIIKEITGNNENIFYYNLGIDAIITVSSLFSSVLVKMMKRRTLLFSTGFTAVAFLFSICGYLYLVSKDVISNDRTYIPISLFVVYFIFSNLGCTTIPLALLGEIFPLDHRGASSCIAGFLMSICMTLGMNLTPYLLVYVKIYGTFALLGAVMGSSLIVLWLILPETKDKTLQEIENYINFGEFNIKDDEEAKLKMMPI